MKTQKTLSSVAIAFAAVLALASCNQSDDILADGPKAVQFTAGIGEQAVATPQTRVAGTSWQDGDAIGVFMLKNKETSIAATYAANKKFATTTQSASLFLPELGNEIYYLLDADNHVDFIAYYPYNKGEITMDSKIDVSTANQSKQPEFDMMWAKANSNGSGYDKYFGGNIPLAFTHCLARLTMNIKAAANTALVDLDGMVVTIDGMNTATTFAIRDGAIGTATTKTDFTAHKAPTASGYMATYDAIIVPATYASGDITVTFDVHDMTFTWKMDAVNFESGNDYVYDVILTLTGVKAEGNINPWTTVNEGPVLAE